MESTKLGISAIVVLSAHGVLIICGISERIVLPVAPEIGQMLFRKVKQPASFHQE